MRTNVGTRAGWAVVAIACIMVSDRVQAQQVRAAQPNEFGGDWEATSYDQTSSEIVKLRVAGGELRGTLTRITRGFFSRRVTVDYELQVEGNHRNGAFDIRLQDPQDGWKSEGVLRLRGEFLVLVQGASEQVYARPGRSLESSAEGSAEAETLARSIIGRVYSASRQASGQGAFVGGRLKYAFCADGSMEYDKSNLASTPGSLPGGGVDAGSAISRRGRWSIVLRGGAPTVRADWHGTGTSYSLVAYFRVRPSPNGASVNVDGLDVPVSGRC